MLDQHPHVSTPPDPTAPTGRPEHADPVARSIPAAIAKHQHGALRIPNEHKSGAAAYRRFAQKRAWARKLTRFNVSSARRPRSRASHRHVTKPSAKSGTDDDGGEPPSHVAATARRIAITFAAEVSL